MERYEPYYADDTHGVHFQVCVDGRPVQAYVARAVLSAVYGVRATGIECVTAYLQHQGFINDVVVKRVRAEGRETVLVQAEELRSGKP